jgi:hypothetical protein
MSLTIYKEIPNRVGPQGGDGHEAREAYGLTQRIK